MILPSRGISARRNISCLHLHKKYCLKMLKSNVLMCTLLLYRTFGYVDGDLELYTCALASVWSRQGGTSRLGGCMNTGSQPLLLCGLSFIPLLDTVSHKIGKEFGGPTFNSLQVKLLRSNALPR